MTPRVMLVLVGLLLTGACAKPLDGRECRLLLDRYTEMLVKEEDPSATPERIAHEQDEARAAAKSDRKFDFASCPNRVARRSFDCAMGATSVDAIERCLVF